MWYNEEMKRSSNDQLWEKLLSWYCREANDNVIQYWRNDQKWYWEIDQYSEMKWREIQYYSVLCNVCGCAIQWKYYYSVSDILASDIQEYEESNIEMTNIINIIQPIQWPKWRKYEVMREMTIQWLMTIRNVMANDSMCVLLAIIIIILLKN